MSDIRIPEGRVNALVRAAYALSNPQGLGFLHYDPSPMTAEQADAIISAPHNQRNVGMDYVSGRAVKLTIFKDSDGFYLQDNGRWYDHTDEQWEELKRIAQSAP